MVPGFVWVVYAHHMYTYNSDKSIRRKYMFSTSLEVKMLHHRLPTYLIEYQQKIIQVSMQISYKKQKHSFPIYLFIFSQRRKKRFLICLILELASF